MPGASPLVDDLDMVRRLEDAGAVGHRHALALRGADRRASARARCTTSRRNVDAFAEATSFFPPAERVPPRAGRVPGAAPPHQGGRDAAGHRVAQRRHGRAAGSSTRASSSRPAPNALELNVYYVATDLDESGGRRSSSAPSTSSPRSERQVKIPIAVKLSPFHSSLAQLRRASWRRRARTALVLFNRFYQPDIDIEALEVVPQLHALRLVRAAAAPALAGHPLRAHASSIWRCSGGVHTGARRASRRSWPAPTRCRWCRRCCGTGPGT